MLSGEKLIFRDTIKRPLGFFITNKNFQFSQVRLSRKKCYLALYTKPHFSTFLKITNFSINKYQQILRPYLLLFLRASLVWVCWDGCPFNRIRCGRYASCYTAYWWPFLRIPVYTSLLASSLAETLDYGGCPVFDPEWLWWFDGADESRKKLFVATWACDLSVLLLIGGSSLNWV